jgi:hypothetical protein
MIKTPDELDALVRTTIRELKDAGLNAQPLERVRETAFTTGNEWMGELGVATWKVAGQDIRDEEIRKSLDQILKEVRRVWPGILSAAKNSVHPELLHRVRLNRYVGTPIMGLIALGIFRSVVAAAIRGDEDWLLLLLRTSIGALFAWAAAYAWTSMRWYRHVSRLVRQTDPIPVQVRFGWAEHALVATVTPVTAGQFKGRAVLCSPPLWKKRMDLLEGTEILGYVDPDPRGPIVLETRCGLIWPLERGRVEILK